MRPRARHHVALGSAVALLALSSVAGAQQPEPPSFTESVEVQLVNVEVWVTDRDGDPVRGLAVEDFEVLEDGEPVEITYFSEIRASPYAPEVPRAPRTAQQTDTSEPSPGTAPPGSELPHLVLYFDELHLRAGSRKSLVDAVRSFLDTRLVPPERILVLRQGESLSAEAVFGSTREQIDAALDRLSRPSPLGARTEQEKRLAVDELQRLWVETRQQLQGLAGDPCGAFVRVASPEIERYALQSRARIAVTLDHLASVAGFLAGVPGTKTVLYLADALETSPGLDLLDFVEELCPVTEREASLPELSVALSDDFRRLTRHASANRVTIYALQPEGLRTSSFNLAQQGDIDTRGLNALQSSSRMGDRDGLTYLARETGGRAVFNTNRLDGALADIGHEINSYYSLAYEPPHGGDGLEHRISVRMRPRGLDARHRRGYRDKSDDDLMTERMAGALYLGLVTNDLGARLGASEVVRREGGRFLLPLHVMVPVASLAFVPSDQSSAASLKALVNAHDHRGIRRAAQERLFRIEPPKVEGTQLFDLLFELELEEGLYTVVVGLRDELSRQSSYVSTTIEISDPERAQSTRQ